MVKVTRHIFDVTDLAAVRLRCNKCGRETVQNLANARVPNACPICGFEWDDPLAPAPGDNWQLISAMQGLLRLAQDNRAYPMTIRFEIDGDEAENATGPRAGRH